MKKRILSILLVLIMVFSMLPMTALAAEEEPVTPVNTPSVSTPDSSAVQIVKSVSEVNNDGTYTLSMDAYVTGDVVTTNPDPLDIVLVLDVSGSMKDDISIVTSSTYVKSNTTNAIAYLLYNYNDQAYFYLDDGTYYPVTQFWHEDGLIFGTYYCSYEKDGVITTVELGSSIDTTKLYYVTAVQTTISKMDALKNAVNSFIAKTAEKNAAITDDSAKHRISIVKFAGKSTNEIGNDMYKDRDYNYNYSQIVTELTTVDDAGAAALKAKVNKITPAGATSADYGLEHANTVLSDSTRSKVVIFFTDGEPNHGNGFDNGVANDAIKEAKKLKDARATVYTIGVFANADPTDTTRNVNKFMHAVSSNYPTAESLNNMGNRTPGSDYYKTANSEEALTKIFDDIADEMVPDVEAGSNSILTDTVSGCFTAPEVAADVTVEVYQASGNGVAPVWTKDETFDTTGIIASVESQNISVTGFDYSANAVVQDAAGNWTGKKLVISFDITPNPNATWSAGTNEYPTNVAGENDEENAGLAYGNDKTELTESPTVLITAYTVEYAYDGTVPEGARTLPAVGVYLPGTEVTVAATPELDGYTFDGWYLNGEKVTSFTMPAENVTLTGTWSQNEYTVSYDYGTAPAGASALPVSATYHYGDTVTVADAATAPGYTFDGWYLNGQKVTSFTMPAENVTLTGTWSQNEYTVSYDYGTAPAGASALPATATYHYGDTVTVADAATAPGYTFNGWYLNGEKVTSFTMPAENVTLTGTWSQNEYTVSYDYGTAPAGASALPATATYHYGDTVTVADAATAPGYTFDGWYLNGEKVTSFTMPAENVTLTGTWSLIPVPGLTVTKTADDEKASVGDTISWNITVKNTGNVDLTGITLSDTLKAAGDVTLYDANSRALPAGYTFSLGKGEEVKFTAKYKVTSADAGKTICNTIVAAVPGGPSGEDTSEGTQIRPIFPVVPVLPVLNTEDHVAYIIGYADDTVRPENNITRAEVATIFFRLLTDSSREFYWTQKNDYSDVNRGDWFNNAVSTLSNAGIITGYPDGTFRPNAPITRAEFAAIAARFSDVAYSGKNTFSDVPDTHWAARCITLAEHLGWVAGYPDGTFRPNKAITRAEAMTLINRVLERAVDEKHMLPNMVTWSDNKPGAWYYEAVQEATNSHEYTRLTSRVSKLDFFYENWTKILPVPDWAALEKTWSDASSK